MAHYIDKDRIVAEIEKLKDRHKNHNTVVGMAYNMAYNDILSSINTLEVKEVPIWEKVSPDTGQTTLYQCGEKCFLERDGYRIDLKDLDKLPKKNSTHRTPADIEAAMQEVEAKSEAYTDAHKGERDDDVLSQMRGESVCEDLEKEGKEWLRPQLDKSYANYGEAKMMELTHFMLEAIEFGAKWQKEQMMKGAFEFAQKHNDACVLASECLRNHGWFNREHDFNDLFLYLSCVDELFAGKFSGKTKVIVIKED